LYRLVSNSTALNHCWYHAGAQLADGSFVIRCKDAIFVATAVIPCDQFQSAVLIPVQSPVGALTMLSVAAQRKILNKICFPFY
jgi:hypothetical protein